MPMFMDHHRGVEGLTAEAVAEAHKKDLEIQGEYGVKYHRYRLNEETDDVFCLAEAPNKEAAEAVHREAHGLVADEITEVKEGSQPVAKMPLTANDPLMSAMGKLSDANPMSNIMPIDWMAISKALQTLHQRQISDPQRTTPVATDYNHRLFEMTMKVWSDTASRFSGLPRQEEEEEEGKKISR